MPCLEGTNFCLSIVLVEASSLCIPSTSHSYICKRQTHLEVRVMVWSSVRGFVLLSSILPIMCNPTTSLMYGERDISAKSLILGLCNIHVKKRNDPSTTSGTLEGHMRDTNWC